MQYAEAILLRSAAERSWAGRRGVGERPAPEGCSPAFAFTPWAEGFSLFYTRLSEEEHWNDGRERESSRYGYGSS